MIVVILPGMFRFKTAVLMHYMSMGSGYADPRGYEFDITPEYRTPYLMAGRMTRCSCEARRDSVIRRKGGHAPGGVA